MARDTKKVNLTLNMKAANDLDQLAAAGHRTRTQQIELLIAREWHAVNPCEYPGLYQNAPVPTFSFEGQGVLGTPPHGLGPGDSAPAQDWTLQTR